jgi:hypothetical protein
MRSMEKREPRGIGMGREREKEDGRANDAAAPRVRCSAMRDAKARRKEGAEERGCEMMREEAKMLLCM